MTWPLMWRVTHEAAIAGYVETIAQLRERVREGRDEYAALSDRYHAMKLAGAVETPPPVTRATPDRLAQALTTAIAGLPPELRRAAQLQLVQDRKAIELGVLTEEDVLRNIQRGASPDGVPDVELAWPSGVSQ